VTALAIRDPDAPATTTGNKPKPDPTLRDYENVPLPTKRVNRPGFPGEGVPHFGGVGLFELTV